MAVGLELNYSFLDRVIHRIAFAAAPVQLTAADAESALFHADFDDVRSGRPIFITSLPRAGTTLLLEALHQFPSLAAHLYRDMPFVMAPVLWSRVMGAFRKRAELRERAHGDGMQVGYDSPEAFEEVLWRAFWPEKYEAGGIALWQAADGKPEAQAFFAQHLKKIIALRRPDRRQDGRYISKNNANIARLDLIRRMFPDATVVVPFRNPVEHAISMLRQHRNFTRMHAEQPFVRRYMADIGHYEFGALHRPIAFPGLEGLIGGRDPLGADYWLAYWIAAFDYVLARGEGVILVPYEAACHDAKHVLADICARAEIAEDGALPAAASRFNDSPSPRGGEFAIDAALRDRAAALHAALIEAARSARSPMDSP
jgi:hypothetical protein